MSFLELVNNRESTRRYDPDRPVERAQIDSCLQAARLAPSACNAQPWRFIVVDEPDTREQVARETFVLILARQARGNYLVVGFER